MTARGSRAVKDRAEAAIAVALLAACIAVCAVAMAAIAPDGCALACACREAAP